MFNKCHKGIHKFEARYDVEPSHDVAEIKGSTESIKAFFRGIEKRTYIHDVCIKCGKTIKKGD